MRIIKKVQAEYFRAVVDGRKIFEVRLADFKCQPGDILILQEQKPESRGLSGRQLECEVLYKLNIKEVEKFYSQEEIKKYGLVVLAIRRKYRFN
jgi:ASC-1-like (ASCH) protein